MIVSNQYPAQLQSPIWKQDMKLWSCQFRSIMIFMEQLVGLVPKILPLLFRLLFLCSSSFLLRRSTSVFNIGIEVSPSKSIKRKLSVPGAPGDQRMHRSSSFWIPEHSWCYVSDGGWCFEFKLVHQSPCPFSFAPIANSIIYSEKNTAQLKRILNRIATQFIMYDTILRNLQPNLQKYVAGSLCRALPHTRRYMSDLNTTASERCCNWTSK